MKQIQCTRCRGWFERLWASCGWMCDACVNAVRPEVMAHARRSIDKNRDLLKLLAKK
jgi:hypothetical protein